MGGVGQILGKGKVKEGYSPMWYFLKILSCLMQ